ncbi:MAG: class II glutamine amidotransferase [Eubacterium sp.]|nr:class II glutamine amidotransferase [Eubacterium sp.]
MCELFAVSAKEKLPVTGLLKEFFSHSKEHPNGWGLAVFDGNHQNVEREPVRASNSLYLKNRLSAGIQSNHMLAHIRRATVGDVDFRNTHPFVKRDVSGRTWTLIHNGTIFEASVLSPYQYSQAGSTDSERILLYLVDRIDENLENDWNSFDVNERFHVAEQVTRTLAQGNKLNLIFDDGEYLYIHKNAPGTLYIREKEGEAVISTRPLDAGNWNEIPLNQLLIYKDGTRIYTGEKHGFTYVEDPEQVKLLYVGFSGL